MNPELIITADGSHTIFLPKLNETYHSIHGAIAESQHVFIQAGLHQIPATISPVSILEIGLGTGLNALLTWLEAEQHQKHIFYTTLEPNPLNLEIIHSLNYTNFISGNSVSEKFGAIHQTPFGKSVLLSPLFRIEKLNTTLEDYNPATQFHLIYFDAFGPRVQPAIWSPDNFQKLFHALLPGGILVTYCAKGAVRRLMQEAGYTVERLPGPPGKREMLRAQRMDF